MVIIILLYIVVDEKNTQGFLAILMTMRVRRCRCNAARIAQWSTTRASRGATEHRHRAITCTVLPRHFRHGHRRRGHNKHNIKKLLASDLVTF